MLISVSVGMSLGTPSGFGADESEESAMLAAPGRGPRRGRILIMDDDDMMRDMMSRQLAICGYEVAATARGEEAVYAYRQAREAGRPFDAVILDLVIPNGWGGEQTLSELLKLDPGVKAMVCSGSLAGPNAHYEQQGFRGILGKPYMLAELRSQLETVLLSQGSV